MSVSICLVKGQSVSRFVKSLWCFSCSCCRHCPVNVIIGFTVVVFNAVVAVLIGNCRCSCRLGRVCCCGCRYSVFRGRRHHFLSLSSIQILPSSRHKHYCQFDDSTLAATPLWASATLYYVSGGVAMFVLHGCMLCS